MLADAIGASGGDVVDSGGVDGRESLTKGWETLCRFLSARARY